MTHAHLRRRDAGFTLVEVMVAIAIFGIIAAAGVAILSFGVRAGALGAHRLDGAAAIGRTDAILAADLAQALDRPTRDESGVVHPALVGEAAAGTAGEPMLTLVRGGWSNLDDAPRAGAQKVAWRLSNGALERIAWPALDGATPLAPAAMMTGVADVRLRYRFAGAWNDRWDGRLAPLPQAVEVTIVPRDGGAWRELFLVAGGAPAPVATPTASATPGAR